MLGLILQATLEYPGEYMRNRLTPLAQRLQHLDEISIIWFPDPKSRRGPCSTGHQDLPQLLSILARLSHQPSTLARRLLTTYIDSLPHSR
jgi:hypothetical protein